MKILEILKNIEENTGSAFFYTPNIYDKAKSFLFKTPAIKLKAKNRDEVEQLLEKVDTLSQKEDLAGVALIPYEIGYYFQPKKIKKEFANLKELKVNFYDKKDVITINSNEIDFSGVEDEIKNFKSVENISLGITKEEYVKIIKKIKNYIKEGDTYQINYTTIATFKNTNSLSSLFLTGIFNQSASYSAIINKEEEFILSFSPELFFKTDYKTIITKPMKGTVKRKGNPEDDEKLSQFLSNDSKNKAENVMIVDLMRNDIGKISKIGSVKVTKFFEVEKYETLYQLTSTVKGELKERKISSIIKNLFPSGSITGAPKIRSMKIISELEKFPRNLYTGSIGIFDSSKSIFNIPIRTLAINKKNNRTELGLGSGIVWDSDKNNEYEEILLKGKFITQKPEYFELLETILWEHGNYFLLDYHLKRMQNSAKYFLFKFDELYVKNKLFKITSNFFSSKKYKVRLVLSKWGHLQIKYSEIEENKKKFRILVKRTLESRQNKFYFHKTTNRIWDKDLKEAKLSGYDEVVYVNKKDQILEGTYTNILIQEKNQIFTPPLNLGILNGCYRNFLLDNNNVKEKILTISDLKSTSNITLCNSVRKEIEIKEIEYEIKND